MNKKLKRIVAAAMTLSLLMPYNFTRPSNIVKAAGGIITKVDTKNSESQVQYKFPEDNPTDAIYARYRRVFKGYAKRGTILVENYGAKTAEVYINGRLVDISEALNTNNGKITVDIGKYTIDGENSLKVLNVNPSGSYINIKVSYPELTYGKPEEVGFSSEKLAQVDEFINAEVEQGFPGAALIVVKDGKIIKNTAYGYKKKYEGYNLLEKFDPMNVDTMFDLASNSKMFATNLALQKLVYEGKLNVDDLVTKYIPGFKDSENDKYKFKSIIKVRDLLNHCAGFAPSTKFHDPKASGELYSQDRATTLKMLEKVPLIREPRTKIEYSDTDYMLLGYIIEIITGQREDEYVENNIYKPLGLTHTMYNPLAKGYKKEDTAATERNGNTRDGSVSFPNVREYTLQGEVHDEKAWYSMAGVAGHAGLFSNTNDMAVLAQLILNGGGYGGFKLFNQDTLDKFTKPTDKDITYGLGWDRQGDLKKTWEFGPYASNLTIGHTGWTGTVTNIDFKNDMAVILLTNVRHTPCPNGSFEAYDKLQTGRYGSVMSLVYEALMEKKTDGNVVTDRKVTEEAQQEASQIDSKFPEDNPTSRTLARYRRVFKAYKGRGEMVVENNGASSAEVYINGQLVDISSVLKSPNGKAVIDISKYTVDGENAIKVLNVLPDKSYINVKIAYPELIYGEPKTEGFSEERLSKFDELINSEVEKGFPGAALVVVKDGKIIKNTAYGYKKKYDGEKALEKPEAMSADTMFDLASVTKMFSTNLAIQKLVSEKKLGIDDKVSKYIAEFAEDKKENITIRQLLTHSAGFAPEIKYFDPNSKDFYSLDRDKTLSLLLKTPLAYEIGSKSVYSDTDYIILGYIIEKITGQKQDEYVEKNIYKPLGLTHTMYNPLMKGFGREAFAATELLGNTRSNTVDFPGIRKGTIQGEVHDEKAFYSLSGVAGHAGLFSNTQDMAVLAQVLLNGGGYGGVKLFDKETLDQFIKPSEIEPTLALGWDRQADAGKLWEFGAYASEMTYGHTGWTGTSVLMDPKNDIAIVLLTNLPHSKYDAKTGLFDSYSFQTSWYGNIMSQIYEAFMEKGEYSEAGNVQAAKDQATFADMTANHSDLNAAKILVNRLPEGKDKTELLEKLKSTQDKIDGGKNKNPQSITLPRTGAQVDINVLLTLGILFVIAGGAVSVKIKDENE
jgi:CubicO group peptidase (beta-lactamase class C family)